MLETFNKSTLQIGMLAKVLGIFLVFVLTSCPLKASIKQSFSQERSIENRNNKSLRFENLMEQTTLECSSSTELFNGSKMHHAEVQFQPALIVLGLVFLFAYFMNPHEKVEYAWDTTKLNLNPSLIQLNRLNI